MRFERAEVLPWNTGGTDRTEQVRRTRLARTPPGPALSRAAEEVRLQVLLNLLAAAAPLRAGEHAAVPQSQQQGDGVHVRLRGVLPRQVQFHFDQAGLGRPSGALRMLLPGCDPPTRR